MKAAQQAFVERLRGAIQRAVVVRVVRFGRRKQVGHPVDRCRRGRHDSTHVRLDGRFEHVERAGREDVHREARLVRAERDSDRRLMEDQPDTLHRCGDGLPVANVAVDDRQTPGRDGVVEIRALSPHEVVQHDDLDVAIRREQEIRDVRTDESRAASYKRTFWLSLHAFD